MDTLDPPEHNGVDWQAQVTDLKVALHSRVCLEQAKGRIGERIGLSIDEAFELLRYAARSQGMKLAVLAGQVMEDGQTPQPIIDALGRRPQIAKASRRASRVLRTEEHFRGVNEAIANLLLNNAPNEFLCECGNPHCNIAIRLPRSDLRLLHETPNSFAIIPGHQIPDLESVVADREGYLIVQTFT